MNLGCGNSEFCERMYDEGFYFIDNIDICENVIKFMQDRNVHREKMTCKVKLKNFSWSDGCEGSSI